MYEIITTEETPKKSLKLKSFKLKAPRSDYLFLIIMALIGLDILLVLIAHRVDESITALIIGLVLYFILKREEKEPEVHKPVSGKVTARAIEVDE